MTRRLDLLAALGRRRPLRYAGMVLVVAFFYALPYINIPILNTPGTNFASVLFYPIGIYVLCGIGLDLAVGRAGIVNFGFAGFFAIGAYTMAYLSTKAGLDYYEVLPLAALAGMIAAVILGLATLRLRGDYLSIVTLAFGLIVATVITNSNWLGGVNGIANIPPPGTLFGLQFGVVSAAPYDVLLLTIIVITVLVTRRLFKSRVGRAWSAIREDEDAAELMGVPTFRFKLLALVIGGAIGGIAGATYGTQELFVSPDTFDALLSVMMLSSVVLGGSGNLLGVVVGAFLVAYLPERFRGFSDYRVLIFSLVLAIMMVVRPEGLIPRRRRRPSRTTAEAQADADPPAVAAAAAIHPLKTHPLLSESRDA